MSKYYSFDSVPFPPYSTAAKVVEFDTKSVNSKFDKSCVDYSMHVPQGEISKALKSGKIQGTLAQALYDFPDGKDTGFRPPISRNKGVDIAEVSQEVKQLDASIGSEVKKALRRKDAVDKQSQQPQQLQQPQSQSE